MFESLLIDYLPGHIIFFQSMEDASKRVRPTSVSALENASKRLRPTSVSALQLMEEEKNAAQILQQKTKKALRNERLAKKRALQEKKMTVRLAMSRLPHYGTKLFTTSHRLDSGDAIVAYVKSEFIRSLVGHRGPRRGDPVRQKPKVEFCCIDRIFTPRLQEKY